MKTTSILTASILTAILVVQPTMLLAQPTSPAGTLKAPTAFQIVINGKVVGKTTLPPGAKVSILKDDPSTGKTLVKSRAGETWVATNDVEIDTPTNDPAPSADSNSTTAPEATPNPTPMPEETPSSATPMAETIPSATPAAETTQNAVADNPPQNATGPKILYMIGDRKTFLTQDLEKINALRAAGYQVTTASPKESPFGWPALTYTIVGDPPRHKATETGILDGDCTNGKQANMDSYDILFLGTFQGPTAGAPWPKALNEQAIQQKKLIVAKAKTNMKLEGLTDMKIFSDSRKGASPRAGVLVKSPTVIFYQDPINPSESSKNAQVLKTLLKELQARASKPNLR